MYEVFFLLYNIPLHILGSDLEATVWIVCNSNRFLLLLSDTFLFALAFTFIWVHRLGMLLIRFGVLIIQG